MHLSIPSYILLSLYRSNNDNWINIKRDMQSSLVYEIFIAGKFHCEIDLPFRGPNEISGPERAIQNLLLRI